MVGRYPFTATAVTLALVGAAAPAATAHQPTTDGTWRTDGYSTVLFIRHGTPSSLRRSSTRTKDSAFDRAVKVLND
ncbi:hypothetical protein GCM10010347_43370 [Streptomyces cirratus]|uniref:Histidine phosphatase family protein n=1 Tax=Streptomyces cirratus TaxID=68187 RepID=A0ABQ3EYE8_9ACTN|nr:hypothetical protein [Streptomyces cirratus]GHB68513.1 hypothetical protein GCM10010347_43370 [Streptomyces cirratus]